MMVRFEENEYILIAMFQKESRQATIEEIHSVIPHIWDIHHIKQTVEK